MSAFPCGAWAADKTQPLADLLVQRGWITADERGFLDKQLERKLAKHQHDPRVTLNAVTRGDVCDALKELEDSDINRSLSSWPTGGPVLVEAIGEPSPDSPQPASRYTWLSEVGKGGLGKVWLARDNDLVREVALKEIRPDTASRNAIRMLIKEAQITGQLQHPNIVPVYEVSRGGRPFYTMKLVKGETLAKAIQRHHQQFAAGGVPGDSFDVSRTLTPTASWNRHDESRRAERTAAGSLSMQRLMSVFLNVCDALAYAHSRGVIHRDLKPLNIVLGDYGEAIVLDWGLARKVGEKDDDAVSIRITGDAQTEATQAGALLGTPGYMAPEQASGHIDLMDQRTDVYGLGAILFEILAGRAPHRKTDHETIADLLRRIATGDTPHARELAPSLPEELDAICATAMGKTRDERYQTAKDLKAALLEFQVHKESIDLAASAAGELDKARRSNDYQDFSRALFGFEEAIRQWPANTRASAGITETRTAYAQSAFEHGDYDLALSLLEASRLGTLARPNDGQERPACGSPEVHPEFATLRTKIQLAATERASRQHRIRRLRRFGIAASLTAAVIASVAALWINAERRTANVERQNAVAAKGKADKQRKRADEKELEARRRLYVADMNLAQAAWEDARVGRVLELLEQHGPGSPSDDLRGFEWFYWDRLCHRELHTLTGHTRAVVSVAFSPDGARIASASSDNTVKLWDAATGQETATLKGHTSDVTSVAFSPDGARVASASFDQTVKLWDAVTGQETATLNGHTSWVTSVAFSPDGARIAAASVDRTVKLWDAVSGQETATLKGHTSAVTSVVFSPDGARRASASWDPTVKLWDAATGQATVTLKGHTTPVESVAFSPDGAWIASVSYDRTVKLWDARPWTPALRLEQQARCLLIAMAAKATTREALLKAIDDNRTFTEPARKLALQWAATWPLKSSPLESGRT